MLIVSSHVTARARSRLAAGAIGLGGVGMVLLGLFAGCADHARGVSANPTETAAVPASPRVVALGNLGKGRGISHTQAAFAEFLFGEQPEAPLGLTKPGGFAAGTQFLACDVGLNAVLRWNTLSGSFDELPLTPRPSKPISVKLTIRGDLLVVDSDNRSVGRYSARGSLLQTYRLGSGPFQPADTIEVGSEVWVSNIASHRMEVFEADSGHLLRSIGTRGARAGEFGVPLALTIGPTGDAFIVDMLNARVQVFDPSGRWIRNIGGLGDRVGTFGRPKSVAVGPDGTTFVVDAASQRVHAFDSRGRPLTAFGEPGSGPYALSLPACVQCSMSCPIDSQQPLGFQPAYYVLVAEQLNDPGIRVFAWSGSAATATKSVAALPRQSDHTGTPNPHWSVDGCVACHSVQNGRVALTEASTTDSICLACHDGRKAHAEAHPIGRLASTAKINIPGEFPLTAGRIGCVTCHDVHPGNDPFAIRPDSNSAFVRGYDGAAEQPLAFCARCHAPNDAGRANPHRQIDSSGRVLTRSCLFCHTDSPMRDESHAGDWNAPLRLESSALCLRCHSKHWDFSVRGHVERPATERVLSRLRRDMVAGSVVLPLHDSNVACFTCHNPHDAALRDTGLVPGTWARTRADIAVGLRLDRVRLCFECHGK